MSLKNTIAELALEIFEEVRYIRRHLHQYPELSFEEFETSRFICSKLDEYGIPYQSGFVQTGIVAKIEGRNPDKKVIALRADIDALPIQETNKISYRSQNDGIMHACGHDFHTASLLGTAKILNHLKTEFDGTILLIFQPAEEKYPGGATLMMQEGALDNPSPEMIVGLHVLPDLPTGMIGIRPGKYMASGDEIYFTVKGPGGHGALPHQTVDTVLVTAQIITSLQQIVSRNAPAHIPTVLSFGRIIANGSTNIIPSEVQVAGTFRTMDENWRARGKELIVKIATAIAESMGAEIDFTIHHGYPVLINNPELTENIKRWTSELLGPDKVIDLDVRMTCEDFAFYSNKYPVCFIRIGTGRTGELKPAGLHTPCFDLNEDALVTAMQTSCWIAIQALQQEKNQELSFPRFQL